MKRMKTEQRLSSRGLNFAAGKAIFNEIELKDDRFFDNLDSQTYRLAKKASRYDIVSSIR